MKIAITLALIIIIWIILYRRSRKELFEFRITKFSYTAGRVKYKIEQARGSNPFEKRWRNLIDSKYVDFDSSRFCYNNLISENIIYRNGWNTPEEADSVLKEVLEIIKANNTIKEYKC